MYKAPLRDVGDVKSRGLRKFQRNIVASYYVGGKMLLRIIAHITYMHKQCQHTQIGGPHKLGVLVRSHHGCGKVDSLKARGTV